MADWRNHPPDPVHSATFFGELAEWKTPRVYWVFRVFFLHSANSAGALAEWTLSVGGTALGVVLGNFPVPPDLPNNTSKARAGGGFTTRASYRRLPPRKELDDPMTAEHEDSFDRNRAALKSELEEDRHLGRHSDFRTVLLARATENVAVRRDNRRKWKATASERARRKITNAWKRRREKVERTGEPFTAGTVTLTPWPGGVKPSRSRDRHRPGYWPAYRAKKRAMKLQSQGQNPNHNE